MIISHVEEGDPLKMAIVRRSLIYGFKFQKMFLRIELFMGRKNPRVTVRNFIPTLNIY